MATAKKTAAAKTAVAKPASTGGALVKWDEALAARAKIAAKTAEAAQGGGNFLSFKGGTLSFKGAPVPDDTLDVVVISSVMENQLFEGEYDDNKPQSPICYAFGIDEESMAPHPHVVKAGNAQSERCGIAGQPGCCPFNEWGSADKGRGKACKNVFRLGMITGEDAESAAAVEKAVVFFAKTPVTSGKAWGNYVRTLEGQALPPLAFVTELAVVPAEKQFALTFSAKEKITDGKVIGALLTKADALDKTIDFPYPDFADQPATAARGRTQAAPPRSLVKGGKAVAKPVATKKVAVKRAAKY